MYLIQGCITLIVFSGCSDEDPGAGSSSVSCAENTARSCSSTTELNQGVQPDKASIENLLGVSRFPILALVAKTHFEGSGTYQFCLGSEDPCGGFDGMDAVKTPATITVVRDTTLATQFRTMNGLLISDLEAHDFKLAEVLQFGKLKSTDDMDEISKSKR